MIKQDIIVFDLETGGVDTRTTEPLEIAAAIININNLEFYKQPDGTPVYFHSLMRPLKPEAVEDGALRVNKLTRAELATAPMPDQVWAAFARFVLQFNVGGKNDGHSAPVPAGFNIIGFDLPIVERLCQSYGPCRKDGRQGIFHDRIRLDVMQMAHHWFWWSKEPKSLSLDSLRDFFGMPKDNAHEALQDVLDTGNILIKFLALTEQVGQRTRFRGCFGSSPRLISEGA